VILGLIWSGIRPHLFYWILGAGALFAFHTWLAEHDARMLAEVQVKQSQIVVKGLQDQIASRDADADKQVQVVVKEVAAAKTPAQQIAAIADISSVPLNLKPLPEVLGQPPAAQVDLAPLVEQLGKCKEDAIELGACQKDNQNLEAIALEKDKQVKALGKKPGFWHRIGGGLKTALGGAAVVEVLRIFVLRKP